MSLQTSYARPQAALAQVVRDYVTLTKPKVQSLLLLTTVATMLVAGSPSFELIVLTCLGGYLSAGGAGAVNHWFDRDIDAQMARTADRPVPSGRVAPNASAALGATRPLGIGRVAVRAICASMSRSNQWLTAPAPPALR